MTSSRNLETVIIVRQKFRIHYFGVLAVAGLFTSAPGAAAPPRDIPVLEPSPQAAPTAQFKTQVAKHPLLKPYMNPQTGALDWARVPGTTLIGASPQGCPTCRNVPEEQIADILLKNEGLEKAIGTCKEEDAKNWKWAKFEAQRLLKKIEQKLNPTQLQAYLATEGTSNDFEKVHKRINQLVAGYEMGQ